MGLIFYIKSIHSNYGPYTIEVLPLQILNRILIIGILGFFVPLIGGYITVLTYIKKGKARKENFINDEGKMSREGVISILFSFFLPVSFPLVLFFNRFPMSGMFSSMVCLLTSYAMVFFLPGLLTTFYTKWKFPELFRKGGK